MAIEKSWERQGPVLFAADGEANGLITLDSVILFKVKQRVVVSAIGEPTLTLQVKRVISFTQLFVGPLKTNEPGSSENNLKARTNLTAYTVAKSSSIVASEQPKVPIPPKDINQAVYEHEPTTAIRSFLVDRIGNGYSTNNRFPVDFGGQTINVDIEDRPNAENIVIINIPTKNTEVNFTFPNKTKFFRVRARDDKDVIRVGLNNGDISTGNYETINFGCTYTPEHLNDFPNGYTLYFESKHKDNIDLELHYWYKTP